MARRGDMSTTNTASYQGAVTRVVKIIDYNFIFRIQSIVTFAENRPMLRSGTGRVNREVDGGKRSGSRVMTSLQFSSFSHVLVYLACSELKAAPVQSSVLVTFHVPCAKKSHGRITVYNLGNSI